MLSVSFVILLTAMHELMQACNVTQWSVCQQLMPLVCLLQGCEYGIRVSSRLERFSDMYTLIIESATKWQDRYKAAAIHAHIRTTVWWGQEGFPRRDMGQLLAARQCVLCKAQPVHVLAVTVVITLLVFCRLAPHVLLCACHTVQRDQVRD